MFLKFWIGCAVLAGLLIAGGVLVVRSETRMKSRGNYLEKHFKRYLDYQEGLGRAVSSVADVMASDMRLKQALVGQPPIVTGPAPATPPPPVTGASAAVLAEQLHDQMNGKNGLRPDLFLVFTQDSLVYASPDSPINAANLREIEPVARVRQGTAFFNKLLIHEGKALQVAGVPVTAPGEKRVIGGILLGVGVERYMDEYRVQSDDKELMQHRLVLVREGQVVASVFGKDSWPELSERLKPDALVKAKEGEEERLIVRLKKGDYDFYSGKVEGFAGVTAGPVADLFLLRSRTNLEDRDAVIPWGEMLVGAILSLVMASLLALWITRPIKRFVHQSQRMLEGGADLNQRIEIHSSDETEDLAHNINQVFSRLFGLASEVQGAAFQVGASSAEISAASKQMSEGLRDQTMKIESSTAAVTELSASIQQVAANAVEATKVAEKSNIAVQAAVDRMQQIRGSVETAADKMTELGESSKRIGNIVEVIRQISEQTSLLALNASIEAAHAGEQGRGFAVVADEVSSLARRVGQSAKDIETLIQTIKEQTSEAVHSMQIGAREVEGGTELVTNTLRDLRQLIHVVKDTAVAVQEQAMVSDEIARNMDAVQKIAAEMVSGSEEAVLQGDQLHTLAFNLEQSVGMFNIDGSGAPAPRPPDGNGSGRTPAQRPAALKGATGARRA
ncbi:MAG TPA: methyl-accepting chemotaxis protein [Kofleriaceae bacterium]|nr:methyl-accepting chemotaxis protein [Kofleriaceae bacterium]